jgi:hypothetical protein
MKNNDLIILFIILEKEKQQEVKLLSLELISFYGS